MKIHPHRVDVCYEGYDPDLDEYLGILARSAGGSAWASGFGLGLRDIAFHFDTGEKADRFAEAVHHVELGGPGWKVGQQAKFTVTRQTVGADEV